MVVVVMFGVIFAPVNVMVGSSAIIAIRSPAQPSC
jgi:hypothetical protein